MQNARSSKSSIKTITYLSSVLAIVSFASPTQAATFTVTPTVNRLIQGGLSGNHYSDLFSTNASNTQTTLVKTTNATFNAALLANLGTLGAGETYQINSAVFVVGNSGAPYSPTGSTKESHLMNLAYDETTISWTSFSGMGGAGTAYATANLVTGAANGAGNAVSWDFTTTVRAWLAVTTPNHGLYFSGTGSDGATTQEVTVANVTWQLDAVKVAPPISAPIDLKMNKAVETYSTDIELK